MRRSLSLLVGLLVAAAISPVAEAVAAQSDVQSADPRAVEVERLFIEYDAEFAAQRFDNALGVVDRLSRLADNDDARGGLAALRAAALIALRREAEAREQIARAHALAPNSPDPDLYLLNAGLFMDRYDVAADAIDRLIARFPDWVRELDVDQVFELLRNEDDRAKSRNEDRRVALAMLGFGGRVAVGDYFAKKAVEILVDRGDLSAASELLRYIDEPRDIEDMLVLKRFSGLWPQIEAHAGARLQKVRDSAAADALAAFNEAPDDRQMLQDLTNAYRRTGRFEDAIALRSKLPQSSEEMSSADEQTGWAVNNIALALHEAGRSEEADRLFALLNEAPMPSGKDRWRVSMVINRLELLVADGNYDKANALLERTESIAWSDGSPYARQLVRRLRYCTMSGLGRRAEAQKLLPDLLEHAADAYHATIDGLLCTGDLDAAEKLVLEALRAEENQDFATDFVRSLQPKPLTSDDPSVWQGRWAELRQRPAIAAAFARLGRDMPERLVVPSRHAAGAAVPREQN